MLNVTPKCPNQFEDQDVTYKRISVIDTGSQKLSNYFQEAFAFVGKFVYSNTSLLRCTPGPYNIHVLVSNIIDYVTGIGIPKTTKIHKNGQKSHELFKHF